MIQVYDGDGQRPVLHCPSSDEVEAARMLCQPSPTEENDLALAWDAWGGSKLGDAIHEHRGGRLATLRLPSLKAAMARLRDALDDQITIKGHCTRSDDVNAYLHRIGAAMERYERLCRQQWEFVNEPPPP